MSARIEPQVADALVRLRECIASALFFARSPRAPITANACESSMLDGTACACSSGSSVPEKGQSQLRSTDRSAAEWATSGTLLVPRCRVLTLRGWICKVLGSSQTQPSSQT